MRTHFVIASLLAWSPCSVDEPAVSAVAVAEVFWVMPKAPYIEACDKILGKHIHCAWARMWLEMPSVHGFAHRHYGDGACDVYAGRFEPALVLTSTRTCAEIARIWDYQGPGPGPEPEDTCQKRFDRALDDLGVARNKSEMYLRWMRSWRKRYLDLEREHRSDTDPILCGYGNLEWCEKDETGEPIFKEWPPVETVWRGASNSRSEPQCWPSTSEPCPEHLEWPEFPWSTIVVVPVR